MPLFKKVHESNAKNGLSPSGVVFCTIITLGIVLLIVGLLLMILDASLPAMVDETVFTDHSAALFLQMIPGIPVSIIDMKDNSISAIGLVSWVIGLDVFFVGLGLGMKYKMARWIAMIIFALAAYFDFEQFLLFGFMGSPTATVGLILNGTIVYFLTKLNS